MFELRVDGRLVAFHESRETLEKEAKLFSLGWDPNATCLCRRRLTRVAQDALNAALAKGETYEIPADGYEVGPANPKCAPCGGRGVLGAPIPGTELLHHDPARVTVTPAKDCLIKRNGSIVETAGNLDEAYALVDDLVKIHLGLPKDSESPVHRPHPAVEAMRRTGKSEEKVEAFVRGWYTIAGGESPLIPTGDEEMVGLASPEEVPEEATSFEGT